jgi:DNA-binding CsgD family transcriptional regulator
MRQAQLDKLKQVIKDKVEGFWEPKHDAFGHHYKHKDFPNIQDSVTTKLGILNKPHLLRWAIKKGVEFLEVDKRYERLSGPDREELINGAQSAYTDIRDDAGSVGTQAHDAFEIYIKEWIKTGVRPEDIKRYLKANADTRAIASARALESLFKSKSIVPVASEILVGIPRYSAGTLDFLCFWEGKLTLVDFKTSNAVDKTNYSMQVAAYLYFFKYMTKIPLNCAKIIHLSKDSVKFDVYNVKNVGAAWAAFKSVCAIYDWEHSRNEKCEKDINRIII